MPEQNQNEGNPAAKTKALPHSELPPGVTLRHTLAGHKGVVRSAVFDPWGQTLASASGDQTIKFWDAASGELLRTQEGHHDKVRSVTFDSTGRLLAGGNEDGTISIWEAASGHCLHRLAGHQGRVLSLVFDSSGQTLASGSEDKMVRLWDVASGRLLRTLRGHQGEVKSVAFDPLGRTWASGSWDGTVKLWEVASGKLLDTLAAHRSSVCSVAFDPTGRTLASASVDDTIKLWDLTNGRLLRTLESHTDTVSHLAFSKYSRLLASKSFDGTVRLWSCESWECLAVIPIPGQPYGDIAALDFHPTLPWLVTDASSPGSPYGTLGELLKIWELNIDILFGKAAGARPLPPASHHTTAKVVLVGDSGVGKTGLGWRLAHGEFKEHASTHGQQFWVMPELGTRRADGTECEAILWDLAGQPDYRLIHALFLDDADLALVLFDPTDTRDPLHGVEFWLKQFHTCATNAKCPVVLVAARADRGAPSLTVAELDAFCQQRGLSGYYRTSAKAGEGLAELVARMQQLIPWETKPATTTTQTFKRVKDFVLGLKEQADGGPIAVRWPTLRELLARTDAAWEFTDAEMQTAVGHLENYGYVRRLHTSQGEERVLLKPDLLNNLAASFILEARRNDKGLGALEEKRLLAGGYRFPELTGLAKPEQDILVDAAALLFLERHVCFREQTLDGQGYLVFPELINLKMPPVADTEPVVEGAAYTVSGAVENVYASLVVLLGYTQTFTRTAQWQAQARYEVGGGAVCGFRQETARDGGLDLILYFCTNVESPVRMLFQGMFECFLQRRNLTVTRYEPVACGKCGHALDRAVVRHRTREGKTFAFCNDCGEKLSLPQAQEPIQLTHALQEKVEAQRLVAGRRTLFEQAVFRLQAYVKDEHLPAPECFISYAWGVPEHERWVEKQLATDLQKAGLKVLLDKWENHRIGSSIARFVELIEECDLMVVVGTPLYRQKAKNVVSPKGSVVAAEWDMAGIRLLSTEAAKQTVLPVLREGDGAKAFPPLLRGRFYADFRDDKTYFLTVFDLILSLYNIAPNHPAVADLRESLSGPEMR
ncbi:MAG: repeat-containing protein [Verrucomicrobiaceae bacterium]|nr:repeat-containing protein [Verrucomicrobiaceae bacterium]